MRAKKKKKRTKKKKKRTEKIGPPFQRECKLKDETGLSSRPAPENVLSFADSDNAVKCCILPINLPCCSLPVTNTSTTQIAIRTMEQNKLQKHTQSLERDKNKPAKGGILNPKPGVRPVPQPEPCPLHARHRWAGGRPAPVFGTEAESIHRDSLTSAHINTYTRNRCACVCLHNMCMNMYRHLFHVDARPKLLDVILMYTDAVHYRS